MIAQVFPEVYDAMGKKVLRPFDRRRGPHPTFPMGRYVSQPLTVKCSNLSEMRDFLVSCKVVSDQEQFDKRDYWQPPEDFEKTKKGDCDCFALWTWRQMLVMGYDARVVFGQSGRYGAGHAWVEYFADGRCFLVEPQARWLGNGLPRLSTLNYHPRFSVAWDGRKLSYYEHKRSNGHLPLQRAISWLPEWAAVWGGFWVRNAYRIPSVVWKLTIRVARGFRLPHRPK